MSEHVPSLEELAAKHNVDIEFLRKFQENMNRSNDAQGRWRAWCSPLNDFEDWKEAFVQEMRTMHAPALGTLDTSLFEQ